MNIIELLTFSVKNGATDVHISAGLPPMLRVDGELRRINIPALEAAAVNELLYDIMTESQKKNFEAIGEVDFAFQIKGVSRYRVNIYNQDRGMAAAFRIIPLEIRTLDDLMAPSLFRDISEQNRGLILVTGPTGSGKSTTLTAMIDYINSQRAVHILTIEDPIEYLHKSNKALVSQREVHRDTQSFSNALRAGLREDPDVILVGEMRDIETIRLALTAAETGHLVFGTLHTSSAAKTINRIVDVFPAGEKDLIRGMVSESLQNVISQTLIPRKGGGLVAANEILVCTPAIRNLIRENKIAQIYSALQTGSEFGMRTLDQHLQALVRNNVLEPQVAREMAVDKLAFA